MSTASRTYPIGTPGVPWGAAEKAAWLSRQTLQRSYEQDVAGALRDVPSNCTVIQYGEVAHGQRRYPLLAVSSKDWSDDLPAALVTGGVHGYETSGVLGALRFVHDHASSYESRANLLVVPCVSPWGYEAFQRWTPEAIDPNRSFRDQSPVEECAALLRFLAPHRGRIVVHVDLHESPDIDDREFFPALAARDGETFVPGVFLSDGFYVVDDTEAPRTDFQQAIISAVAKVTHIAQADADGRIIGSPAVAAGVIQYEFRRLGLCAGITGAPFRTTTEVHPDSPRITPEQCVLAQVTAIRAAIDYALANSSNP